MGAKAAPTEALAPRSIVPRVAFGFNSSVSTPVVALEQESLTYITFTGSKAAFVSAEEIGGENLAEGSSKPMHFFPPIRVQSIAARVVTAVAFHKPRKLLGLCVSQLPRDAPPAVVVYSLAMFNGAWVPTTTGTLVWDEGPAGEIFGMADFSADACTVVCVTRGGGSGSAKSVAVGFDWKSRSLVFCSALEWPCEHVCCHPRDSRATSVQNAASCVVTPTRAPSARVGRAACTCNACPPTLPPPPMPFAD